ncbi:unnamed protein product [Cylindrotheca closterium]|uniref:Uncharacterized protein n=1 Tax=Cylindrotheca closterium TaxID=2856 RepID=A0AAD2FNF5_9STRA|nr:unnamed protein product [Cylindrotheca closterium]
MSTAVATPMQPPMISAETPHQVPSALSDTISRKVHFPRNMKTVVSVLSRRDYSNSELRECFYTPDDRHRIECERERLVRRFNKEPNKKHLHSSLRGLENSTREGSVQSEKRVWAVVDSVLNEQDDQLELREFDCYRIASASQSNSTESTLLALRAAIGDQLAAFSIYRDWASDNRAILNASTKGDRSCKC